MNSRFPVLGILAVIIRVAGWIVIAVSGIYMLKTLVDDNWWAYKISALGGGLGGVLVGLGEVALAEMICLAMSIEENTHQANNNLTSRLDVIIRLLNKEAPGGGQSASLEAAQELAAGPPPLPANAPAPDAALRASLAVTLPDGQQLLHNLTPGETTLGRAPNCDLILNDSLASRSHIRLTLDRQGLWVEDLGSHNGTLLNGTKVSRSQLQDGDRLTIGNTSLVVSLKSS